MKILFLSHQSEFIYGGEICTLELMRSLKERGVDVFFAAPPGPYFERAKEVAKCFPISSIQFQRKLRSLPKFFTAFNSTHRELRKILKENDIDLLHATSLKATVYTIGLSKTPVIWHHHDILPKSFSNRKWLRFIGRFSAQIFTPSEAARVALIEAGILKEKVSTIYNGFALSNWKPRDHTLGYKIHLATIGEISYRKGSDWLKSTSELLGKFGMEFEWKVIGAGLSDPEFARKVEQDCASISQISFLGRRNDVAKILQETDFLITPSRQDPLPTVIVEAFLSGVPAIGTKVGGIPEMIQDGVNGFLVDSPEELVEKLRSLNPDRYRSLALSARETAEKMFSSAFMAECVQDRYKKIIG